MKDPFLKEPPLKRRVNPLQSRNGDLLGPSLYFLKAESCYTLRPMSIEVIKSDQSVQAIIVRSTFSAPGISFLTEPHLAQQLAFMSHPEGKKIQPHIHNTAVRTIDTTSEVLIIKKGILRVDFFDNEKNYVESRKLFEGDLILLIGGGHGFEVLSDLEMFEVKQGPYLGEIDKTRFNYDGPTNL
jgi:mannose-6-phosphate isomerase-like protein (cupin superfamily)